MAFTEDETLRWARGFPRLSVDVSSALGSSALELTQPRHQTGGVVLASGLQQGGLLHMETDRLAGGARACTDCVFSSSY